MIMCEIDGNTVLSEPMKNKTEYLMVETHQKMIERLKNGGISPEKHILDNEISEKYKKQLRKWNKMGAGTSRYAQKKRGRKDDTNIQRTFQVHPLWHSRQFPTQ